MTTILPSGRNSDEQPAADPDPEATPDYDPPGYHDERFWRWVNKSTMETNVTKGYHEYRIEVAHQVQPNDYPKAKLKTVCGSCYVLAIR